MRQGLIPPLHKEGAVRDSVQHILSDPKLPDGSFLMEEGIFSRKIQRMGVY